MWRPARLGRSAGAAAPRGGGGLSSCRAVRPRDRPPAQARCPSLKRASCSLAVGAARARPHRLCDSGAPRTRRPVDRGADARLPGRPRRRRRGRDRRSAVRHGRHARGAPGGGARRRAGSTRSSWRAPRCAPIAARSRATPRCSAPSRSGEPRGGRAKRSRASVYSHTHVVRLRVERPRRGARRRRRPVHPRAGQRRRCARAAACVGHYVVLRPGRPRLRQARAAASSGCR